MPRKSEAGRERRRGPCPECGFSERVALDGTMMDHFIYPLSGKVRCAGSGMRLGARV